MNMDMALKGFFSIYSSTPSLMHSSEACDEHSFCLGFG